ncbi:transporter [Leptospira semungkisensis]|uniref:Transporter n=1 Tax=Leptospira semungkisensis TaxID=2484985 RepID=A0A4R9FLB1_9LEPT|nr:outer membrane protein transport protein [Leptospira semungkisensis]TGJ99435.1 transporter [Leptospira semungkisensis]
MKQIEESDPKIHRKETGIRKLKRERIKKYLFSLIFSLFVLGSGNGLLAIDGLYFNAINARYSGLAGAGYGLGGSPVDVDLNPANLSLTKGKKIEFGLGASLIQNRYRDKFEDSNPNLSYQNDKSTNVLGPGPYIALKLPVTDNVDYGISLYVAGGASGGVDKITRNTPTGQTVNQWAGTNLPGPLGNSNQLKESNSNTFAVVKLVNGFSVKLGDLALGASVEAVYGSQKLNQKYYDITGNIEIPGQGYYYQSSKNAFALGGILGANYTFNDWFRVGYAYQAHVGIPLNGGYNVGVNNSKYYHETGVSYTFNLPEKHTLGFAFGPENLKFALDLVYTNYGSYLRKANQTLQDPWLPTPLGSTGSADAHLNFRDQWAAILGVEYKPSSSWVLRAGYAYNSPLVKSNALGGTTGGFFSLTDLVSAGFSYIFDKWSLDFALAYNIPRKTIEGGKGTDWDLSHAVGVVGNANLTGYSYNSLARIPSFNIGATKSFD